MRIKDLVYSRIQVAYNYCFAIFFLEGEYHKVLIYIEHHSICPLVGIGTPPPL
jgi:hypothetical protein